MPTSTRTDAPRKRTRQRHAPHLSFRAGAHTGVGIRVPLCRAKGERIAAPVCELVRNDIIGGLSHSPNHFIRRNACLRVDVASHIPARSAACAFLSHAAGIDPYNEMRPSIANRRNSPPFASTVRRGEVTPPYERLPLSLPRADRVVRPYNRLPTPFARRDQCVPPFIVYTIKKQKKKNTAL